MNGAVWPTAGPWKPSCFLLQTLTMCVLGFVCVCLWVCERKRAKSSDTEWQQVLVNPWQVALMRPMQHWGNDGWDWINLKMQRRKGCVLGHAWFSCESQRCSCFSVTQSSSSTFVSWLWSLLSNVHIAQFSLPSCSCSPICLILKPIFFVVVVWSGYYFPGCNWISGQQIPGHVPDVLGKILWKCVNLSHSYIQ